MWTRVFLTSGWTLYPLHQKATSQKLTRCSIHSMHCVHFTSCNGHHYFTKTDLPYCWIPNKAFLSSCDPGPHLTFLAHHANTSSSSYPWRAGFCSQSSSLLLWLDPFPRLSHWLLDMDALVLHPADRIIFLGHPFRIPLHAFPNTWSSWFHLCKVLSSLPTAKTFEHFSHYCSYC